MFTQNHKAYVTIILDVVPAMKNFLRSLQAATYTLHMKVAISRQRCKIGLYVVTVQSTNRK